MLNLVLFVCCCSWCIVCAVDTLQATELPCMVHKMTLACFSDALVPAISDLPICDSISSAGK